ncbi:MAG TPA: hypothetical protein VF925_05685 [Casimicrobiaceae bacterium]
MRRPRRAAARGASRAADQKLRVLVFHVKQRHPGRGLREALGFLPNLDEELHT